MIRSGPAKITLPFGTPATGKDSDTTVPLPPDDPNRGEEFAERVQALLRRHVVERCIYGVDINPLAIEFARVSLWVETLDPELPFSFLDHKIKVGNSLVGCWLDRLEDYPIKAWERLGGRWVPKESERSESKVPQRAKESVNDATGDGRIKPVVREGIESKVPASSRWDSPTMKLTSESVVTLARTEFGKLHELPMSDPDERERLLAQACRRQCDARDLKNALDAWCSIWFWPTDSEPLPFIPTPFTFHEPKPDKSAVVEELATVAECLSLGA